MRAPFKILTIFLALLMLISIQPLARSQEAVPAEKGVLSWKEAQTTVLYDAGGEGKRVPNVLENTGGADLRDVELSISGCPATWICKVDGATSFPLLPPSIPQAVSVILVAAPGENAVITVSAVASDGTRLAWTIQVNQKPHPKETVGCLKIEQDTVLSEDVYYAADSDAACIEIVQPVTLDCAGHLISGVYGDYGILVSTSNAVVKNCAVDNAFVNAIGLLGDNNRVENVRITSGETAIYIEGNGNAVSGAEIAGASGSPQIDIHGSSNLVARSSMELTGKTMLSISGNGNRIEDSAFTGRGGGVDNIVLLDGNGNSFRNLRVGITESDGIEEYGISISESSAGTSFAGSQFRMGGRLKQSSRNLGLGDFSTSSLD